MRGLRRWCERTPPCQSHVTLANQQAPREGWALRRPNCEKGGIVRKLPVLNDDNRDFWTGGQAGELRIQRCQACGKYVHPPAPVCRYCAAMDPIPTAVSGKGRVHTFTINRQAWSEDMKDPFVIAQVELAEQPGLRFLTNIVGCAPEEVCIDMPVRVVFEHEDGVWYPLFEPEA